MAEYIDRKAIIKHIEEKLDKLTDMPEMGARIAAMESAYNSTLNYIMQIPATDVEPVKHGHWIRKLIYNKFGSCIGSMMICSECNKDNKYDKRMDYCPNCGAKMDGKEVQK